MLVMRLLDTLALQLVKRLGAMRLELGNVALGRRLGHAEIDDPVDAAAQVRGGRDAPLVISRLADVDPDGPQVADDLRFLGLAASEHPQDSSRKGGGHRPAKRQPEPPGARVAENAAAQELAEPLGVSSSPLLVGLVNQRGYAMLGLW